MNNSFDLSRDKWLSALTKRKDSTKRIKSKLTLIKSRQRRLQNVQRILQSDIAKLQAEVIEIEQYITLLSEELQEHQQAMALSLGGSL